MRSYLARLTPLRPSIGLLSRRCYSLGDHPSQLVKAMQAANVHRAFVRFDPRTQSVQASHPCVEPIKQVRFASGFFLCIRLLSPLH
jgi:hypothetical protein